MIGVSGAGKTSTVRALFAVCDPFEVVDVAGLGEDFRRDPDLLAEYERRLPHCDAVLWVVGARNRGLALDQSYVRRFRSLAHRCVLGINQVDLVEPVDWDRVRNRPSTRQETRIQDIAEHRGGVFGGELGLAVPVAVYSAKTGYGLDELFATLLTVLPGTRRPLYRDVYDRGRRSRSGEEGEHGRDRSVH